MAQALTSVIASRYGEKFPTSARRYARAQTLFPSGVTHDLRYLEPFPIYVDRAAGSKKYDVDGNELVDFWVGHGSLLLGHGHPAVVRAVRQQVERGTHLGACHELELAWGEWVQKLIPSAETIRFVSSGTEATMMAIRVARIVSGKTTVIKFLNHFHGWNDLLIHGAAPPVEPGQYGSPGIPEGVLHDLVIVPPNDIDAVARAIEQHDPACVILEPTGGHYGTVPIRGPFLHSLRELTRQAGVALIFDEVITGFRVHPGGAQGYHGVTPDLTALAKILAGGLPGGCVAGSSDLMQALAFQNPLGKKMSHPGTFNANPLSAAAGCAALEAVSTGEACQRANEMAARIRKGLNDVFARKNVNWIAYGDFSAIKIHPEYDGPRPTDDAYIPFDNDVDRLERPFDHQLSHAFRCGMLLEGVDFPGWGAMTCAAHTDADVDRTISAASATIDLLRVDGLLDH